MSRPISRFPIPALAELPDDMRARIEQVQAEAGFIPNVFLALAHRPDEFRAFFAYHDAGRGRPDARDEAFREAGTCTWSGAGRFCKLKA